MASNEVACLAERYGMPDQAARQLETLLQALLEDPHAPTAVRDRRKAIDDHLADSLVALELDEVRRARSVADLGSGAGLPGLPLAIALPEAQFVLVESAGRKCDFIERTVASCGLGNVLVARKRAEELTDLGGTFDLVTVRAVASLAVVAEYAGPLLRIGGTLVVWRGRRDQSAELEAEAAALELGLAIDGIIQVRPYSKAIDRHLHLMSKVRETPSRFPRRTGTALKRPLGKPSSDRVPR